MISNSLHSQSYTPLLIDSLYTWSWFVDMHGDTLINESWSGFSYDSNDSLIQRRNPTVRLNYSYGADTVYLLSEMLDVGNNWNNYSRTTTAYNNGKITSILIEGFENNAFENAALYTYFYENYKEYISIFPNPSVIGQNLTIKTTNKDKLEVLIFDIQGKLVARNLLNNRLSFPAPHQEGIYTVLIREKGRLIGIVKQVIIK